MLVFRGVVLIPYIPLTIARFLFIESPGIFCLINWLNGTCRLGPAKCGPSFFRPSQFSPRANWFTAIRWASLFWRSSDFCGPLFINQLSPHLHPRNKAKRFKKALGFVVGRLGLSEWLKAQLLVRYFFNSDSMRKKPVLPKIFSRKKLTPTSYVDVWMHGNSNVLQWNGRQIYKGLIGRHLGKWAPSISMMDPVWKAI